MSYILDALKKSDQKRKSGQVPDLNTIQMELPAEEKKKPLWPYIIAGIVVLNMLVFFVVLHPDKPALQQPPEDITRLGQQESAASQAEQSDSKTITKPEPSAALVQSSPSPAADSGNESTTAVQQEKQIVSVVEEPSKDVPVVVENVVETTSSEEIEEMEVAATHVETETTSVQEMLSDNAPEPEQDAVEVTDVECPAPLPDTEEAADFEMLSVEQSEHQERTREIDLTQSVTQPAPVPPAQTAERQEARREPLLLLQLPLSIRKQLPEFHISALFYSRKAASRLASINGHLAREGHSITPDLKVDEITSEGVIFSYRKYLFYVPVF